MQRTRQRSAREGQAALEYLVTYGWGILAILVVIGALAYFGLFDLNRYVPDRCSFGAQLECVDYSLAAGANRDMALVQFRNNFGEDITITRAFVDGRRALLERYSDWATVTPTIEAGNLSIPLQIRYPAGYRPLVLKERQAQRIVIEFQRANPAGPLHNVSGEIFATVRTR